MLKKRDAQGLPIRMVILAVISLIVLIVIITIFSKETGRTVDTLESCGSKGGLCEDACEDGKIIYNVKCEEGVCCANI